MFVTETAALRARYLFPIDGPPIADGLISVDGGRIVAVGASHLSGPVHDLGEVAILPALVNAHTHLEFSGLQSPLENPSGGFCDWIRQVIRHRQERTYTIADAIAAGLRRCQQAQVAAIGEIASQPWPLAPLSPPRGEGLGVRGFAQSEISGIIFRELLGLSPSRESELIDAAAVHLFSPPIGAFRAGLSPHAPYTVSPELVRRAVELAERTGAALAMHLAETTEELELLASHSGPMRILLDDLGVWPAGVIPRGIRPLDYLKLLAPSPRTLVIHGNYLTSEEIRFIAERSPWMSVVYCPRTHAFFGHSNYPLASMLAARVNVALGTDSRASNPDLNLWSEVKAAVAAHPDVPQAKILEMATVNGARALGLERDLGTLSPGRKAAFCIMPLNGPSAADPHELLFAQ